MSLPSFPTVKVKLSGDFAAMVSIAEMATSEASARPRLDALVTLASCDAQ